MAEIRVARSAVERVGRLEANIYRLSHNLPEPEEPFVSVRHM